LALVVMVAFTLPVGRPISDDYCGYISVSSQHLFRFTFESYREIMANFVGFAIYEVFSLVGIEKSVRSSLTLYFLFSIILIGAVALTLQNFILEAQIQKLNQNRVTLSILLTCVILISLALPSPTGNLSMLSLLTLTTTTGIFHVWPILVGLALLIYCLQAPSKQSPSAAFIFIAFVSACNSLMGHAESIAYIGIVTLCWLFAFIGTRMRIAWGRNRINALLVGALTGLAFLALNPGSKSPLAVLRGAGQPADFASVPAEPNDSFVQFTVYFSSYAQDALARNLGNGLLFLAFLLSILAGVTFAKDFVNRSMIAASVGVTSLLTTILLLVIGMGEYFGYPAWYHEVGLFVCFVILFVLLGLLVGGVVAEKWLNPSRWAMVGLVGGYALLLGVGVAAYLSRVEYLQDRADRWDAGYFTTIVHPTDGTLILPDGDSGIEWVAQCAKTFADLRGLEFKNY
jgi:hypothetical protein